MQLHRTHHFCQVSVIGVEDNNAKCQIDIGKIMIAALHKEEIGVVERIKLDQLEYITRVLHIINIR